MSESRGRAFAAIARAWEPKTVSVYRASVGTTQYSLADAIFPVEGGEVVLPDALGRQLELQRLRRHEAIEAFAVSERGELSFSFYPGKAQQPVSDAERLEAERVAALEAGQISPRLQSAIDEALEAAQGNAGATGAETPDPAAIAPQGATSAAPPPVPSEAAKPSRSSKGKR